MRFCAFLAPFHPTNEQPDRALRRDFELIEWLDDLGFDEAWIGEHHSAGFAVIGTPDDAVRQLERLEEQSGGYGCFLQLAHNWADFQHTKRSYELFARYVAPNFQGSNVGRDASMNWAAENRPTFMGHYAQAVGKEMQKHQAEQAAKEKPVGDAA